MNTPYRELLEKIQEEDRRHGEFLLPPATPQQIDDLQHRVRAELGCDLPASYATFLRLSDGFCWNGVTIFGCRNRRVPTSHRSFLLEGCVEANLTCREVEGFEHLLVLGQADMDYYVRDNQTGLYLIIDRVGLYPYETFELFDVLVAEVFRRHWVS